MNVNKFEELLQETNFTRDEYEIYEKVKKNYQLQDLKDILDEKLDDGTINKEQYETAINNADIIVYKYDKWLDFDWRETMEYAIDYLLKGEYCYEL